MQALAAYLDDLVAQDQFSGVVLVARDSKVLFKNAYGLASKSFNVPNRIDTKFNLGSMNKMFTGVAVAQLAQAGKLSFQDTVGKLIPDYRNREVAEKVTVHHLLTHTSGMGNYWNETFMNGAKDRWRTVQDFLTLFIDDPLLFEPGERWEYSNSGFMLLGAIIETVSGQDYFTYVMEHIYRPAGMVNSDAYEMDRPVPNLAIGYTRMELVPDEPPRMGKVWRNNLFMHVVKGGPAGGGFSTIEDLLRFSTALQGHKLLNPDYTRLVMTGKVEVTPQPGRPHIPGSKYAYGFRDVPFKDGHIVGHGGGFPGVSSSLEMYTGLGYTVAVLSNYDMIAISITEKIHELIDSGELG